MLSMHLAVIEKHRIKSVSGQIRGKFRVVRISHVFLNSSLMPSNPRHHALRPSTTSFHSFIIMSESTSTPPYERVHILHMYDPGDKESRISSSVLKDIWEDFFYFPVDEIHTFNTQVLPPGDQTAIIHKVVVCMRISWHFHLLRIKICPTFFPFFVLAISFIPLLGAPVFRVMSTNRRVAKARDTFC